MIHNIYASDARFKSVKFKPGLNVILAERQHTSTDKDSRNGLGKTSLLNVLHFCFGGNLQKKLLPVEKIRDWTFYLELDLLGETFKVSRSIDQPGFVYIEGNILSLPISPEIDEESGFRFYKVATWNEVLGQCLFEIPNVARDKYKPSFRDLISYFIRSGKDSYSEPFSYLRNQKAWQSQIANAFMLGLKWEHATQVQKLKDKNTVISSLNDALALGITSSKGELEAERLRLKSSLDKDKKIIASFKVHPKYEDIQDQANELTQFLHRLANLNFGLKKKLARYTDSIASEAPAQQLDVSKFYKDAGVVFSDSLKKTMDETKEFHAIIVKNREHFLKAELKNIQGQIENNDLEIERLSNERAELLSLLETHGALEEITKLQENLSEKKSKFEVIQHKLEEIKNISSKKKEIKSERVELDLKIQRDFEESRNRWEPAVTDFNENSLALYNESGDLIINISEKGIVKENAYKFSVQIPRSNSEGVSKMKIFCYDLMLVNLFAQRDGINFLIHDSAMFDAVDSRQRAHALEHANSKALGNGFQYICAFNSDMLPLEDFSEGFNIYDFVCLTLSDKDPKDSLFGFRFNQSQ